MSDFASQRFETSAKSTRCRYWVGLKGTPIIVRTPIASVSGSALRSADLGTPAVVVFLVLALGATIFLWRARYIRRRTAYTMMGVIFVALIIFGALLFTASA